MQALPLELRRLNHSGSEECPLCRDTGQVVIGTNAGGTDEMAPCPVCERGWRLEFGHGFDRNGRPVINPHPPWGSDGFWRGREIPAHLDERALQAEPLPKMENALRWRLLMVRNAAVSEGKTADLPDPTVGLSPLVRDPQERLALVQAELDKQPHRPPGEGIQQPTMKQEPRGRCDDCHEPADVRWRYGQVVICNACLVARQTVAQQLG